MTRSRHARHLPGQDLVGVRIHDVHRNVQLPRALELHSQPFPLLPAVQSHQSQLFPALLDPQSKPVTPVSNRP